MPELYQFQNDAVAELLAGKHFIISNTGSGKSAMAMKYAEQMMAKTGKRKILVITTASKVRCKNQDGDDDFTADAKQFCSLSFCNLLSYSLSLVSWHKLKAWVEAHQDELADYIVIADEVQKIKGYTTGMGRAFLKIATKNPDWAGFTGTPGDSWDNFISYFVATGQSRNKTNFMHEYAITQTYKGYPEIVGWRHEQHLKNMWSKISYAPDTESVMSQLPTETHKVIKFNTPRTYFKTLKTRVNAEGELLDTSGSLCAELRRLCFTKEKQEWVKEFMEGLGTGCVMFYNFIKTGDELEQIIKKALPKNARVWRIDGKHHEIPTADTIGEKDVVLCQWQSGSEALNLQFLHYWVSVEACYSYSTSIQARGRIRRLGQQHAQFYYYLKTEKTIEGSIYQALRDKSDFAESNWCINNNINVKDINVKGE